MKASLLDWLALCHVVCSALCAVAVASVYPPVSITSVYSGSRLFPSPPLIPVRIATPVLSTPFNPVVGTRDGALRGFITSTLSNRTVATFLGIPFAQPPVGQLRFRDPVRNLPWDGVRDAIAESPQCLQVDFFQMFKLIGQEDCLYLNVYVPEDHLLRGPAYEKLPVMVWIHGGAYFFGSGAIYGPKYLLDKNNVILVTLNYRLGPLGFLSTGNSASFGNQGLKDQNLALRWVHENIEAFGGDRNSVTIFGESAGGSSVHLHMMSPLSRGLFQRAISQSGSAFTFWEKDDQAPELAKRVGKAMNCTQDTSYEMVECLRKVDGNKLAAIVPQLFEWSVFPLLNFLPVIEPLHPGAFLVESPADTYHNLRAAPVPWIIGTTHDELSWTAGSLTLDPKSANDINSDWDRVGPIMLSIKNGTGNDAEIARKIRNFYLGDKDASFDTRHEFGRLLGDRIIVDGTLLALRYHQTFTGQPVFVYRLSYQGNYSIVNTFGQKASDWGVNHLDDLIYLFNNTNYHPDIKPGDEEQNMSDVMTSLWTNFAIYGRPLLQENGALLDIWQPILPQVYRAHVSLLDLNLKPKMIDDPFVERYNFWRSLNLRK